MDSCETVCVLESFTEIEEVQKLIDDCISLDNLIKSSSDANQQQQSNHLTVESIFETWVKIFDRYQEQPHLIDRHITSILTQLLVPIYRQAKQHQDNCHSTSSLSYHTSCNFIYHLSKVRGFKNLVRHFPHAVTDLEIVIDLLSKESTTLLATWRTRYVLLLWSSLLVTLPFDFKKFDSTETNGQKPLIKRLYDLIKVNLIVGDTPRIAAAVACARFVTRPDVSKIYLDGHIDWCLNVIDEVFKDSNLLNNRVGVLLSLAYIFKLGKREDTSMFARKVLMKIIGHNILSQSKNLLVKMMVKIAQRVGLSLLRVKIASWRYSRGRRSILDSLKQTVPNPPANSDVNKITSDQPDDDDNYQVPEEIEDIISVLLDGLRFNSNLVRWSAAKGIGRITSRLPRLMAGEVVSSVCELLDAPENDGSWHGGCLALAELGRRGLILPDQLSNVIPKIVKASVYEESRGNFSVGETVRDAACYAFWAFARAYDAEILRPFLDEITSTLLVVSVFDREIRCRRAASAAYQETVGRLGSHNVPHGIEILTTVDNQAVGRTRRAFLELSVYVAQFNNHLKPLIYHLIDAKVNHWDQEIRCLSAEALASLIKLAPHELVSDLIIPTLLDKSESADLSTKHGAIISLAYAIHAMAQINLNHTEQILSGIERISTEIKSSLGFKGIKGELYRSAICLLIEKVSLSRLPMNRDIITNCWVEILKDCVFNTSESIRSSAISGFIALYDNYFIGDKEIESIWVSHLINNCKSAKEHTRCGSLEALGSLPKKIISVEMIGMIFDTILKSFISISPEESVWYQWKVSAVNCYTSLLLQMDNSTIQNLNSLVNQIINHTLNIAMEDYTTSSKGDVGEPVRIAAIKSIKKIVLHFHSLSCDVLNYSLINQIVNQLLIHCVSHHNEMRLVAGENFFQLINGIGNNFHLDDLIAVLPSKEELSTVHLRDETNFNIWFAILPIDRYTYNIWKGLVMSTGGIPSSIVKLSTAALSTQLKSIKSADMDKFNSIIDIFSNVYKDNLTLERMCLQLINTLNYLITSGILNDLDESKVNNLIDQTWGIAKTTAIPKKKMATVQLLCSCLRFKGLRKKCLNILCIFLCTKYPFVRTNTADELYTALLIYEDIFEDDNAATGDDGDNNMDYNEDDNDGGETKQEQALRLLTETDWNKDRSILIPIKDKLKSLLSL